MALFDICKLKITNILKLSGSGMKKSELQWEHNVLVIGAFPVEL